MKPHNEILIETDKRSQSNKKLEEAYQNLNQETPFRFKTTDHSIIRYLQRVELCPVSEARYKILSKIEHYFDSKNDLYEKMKNISFKLQIDDIIYVVSKKRVITIETIDK